MRGISAASDKSEPNSLMSRRSEDEISREGIVHLVEVAERLSCDVVIRPRRLFVAEDGQTCTRKPLARAMKLFRFGILDGENLRRRNASLCYGFVIPAISPCWAVSASNLYRTAVLQEKSVFPPSLAGNGDGAWGIFQTPWKSGSALLQCGSAHFGSTKKTYPQRGICHGGSGSANARRRFETA